MEGIVKKLNEIYEPLVTYKDMGKVSKMMYHDYIPNGIFAIGTEKPLIKKVYLETEADNMILAVKHDHLVYKIPLVKLGHRRNNALCACIPGYGPVDLYGFIAFWNMTHGYKLQQLDEVSTQQIMVKAIKENTSRSETILKPDLQVSWGVLRTEKAINITSRVEKVEPSSKTPPCEGTSHHGGKDTSHEEKEKSSSFDDSEENSFSQTGSKGDCSDAETRLNNVDGSETKKSSQSAPPKKVESGEIETIRSKKENQRHRILQLVTNLIVKECPIIEDSYAAMIEQIGEGYISTLPGTRIRIETESPISQTLTKLQEYTCFGRKVQILVKLEHENVVSLAGVLLDDEWAEILVYHIDGGSLIDFLKGPESKTKTDAELVNLALQVACGMEYMAGRGWVHGYLISSNILLTKSMTCKISGFDWATVPSDVAQMTINHPRTLGAAIEVHQRKDATNKSDVWSFGILFLEIMSRGETPYGGHVEVSQLKVYLEIGNRWRRPNCVSQDHYSLMQRCWKLKPKARPTFTELVTTLRKY